MPRPRAAAVLAFLAVLCAVPAAAAPRPTVLGARWISGGSELSAYDTRTLRPVGRSLRLGVAGWPWTRSPDGSRVAVVAGDNRTWTSTLVVVDASPVRRVARLRLADLYAVGGAWSRADRLLVVGRTRDGRGATLVLVDPVDPRELGRTRVAGALLKAAATDDGAVLLLGPGAGIGATRLLVVDTELGVLPVSLDGVTGGRRRDVLRSPGLAVDRAGGRAFVVGQGEPVAEVELSSGAVAYHPLVERAPARAAKSLSGPELHATWLGNDRLAVTGTVYGGLDPATRLVRQTPFGLRIVDTGAWSVQTRDPAISWVVRSGPWLVAMPRDGGLRWFDDRGRLRGDMLGTQRIVDLAALGGRLLVQVEGEPRPLLVDLRAGRVVGSAPPPRPSLPGFYTGEGPLTS